MAHDGRQQRGGNEGRGRSELPPDSRGRERSTGAGREPGSAVGVYMISVAAELAGMHPQTLRIYESRGLITPKRSAGNTRLYSQEDVRRLRQIQELTSELGLNLAGVERVLELEREVERMRRRITQLERHAERLERDRDEKLERLRRSYRREIVPYEAPGQALVPVRARSARVSASRPNR